MQLIINKFTLNYEENGPNYTVWFTNCTYSRGEYSFNIGDYKISSYSYPEFNNKNIYLPGKETSKDNDKILIPKDILDYIISLYSSIDENWDQDRYFGIISTGKNCVYYIPKLKISDRDLSSSCTCKETLMEYTCNPLYSRNHQRIVYLCEQFQQKDLDWLAEIQNNIAPEHRFMATILGPNCLKFEYPQWWMEQGYYRLGWALLALRVVKRRYVLQESDQQFFDDFRNRKWNIKNYTRWSGTANWIYGFTNVSMFE